MKLLVTGTAGFIGYHLALRLIGRGDEVVGLDNVNAYYDVGLKKARLAETGINGGKAGYNRIVKSSRFPGYRFVRLNLEDRQNVLSLFRKEKFDAVCSLAAQAGVRYSLENPFAYVEGNVDGFLNILEACRQAGVDNLSYASSSSVYGLGTCTPFSERRPADHPVSLYAATKRSNELMAHAYSHLFGIRTTGLRFFTVYGPWGRPDMALFLFTKSILEGRPVDVYNNGEMSRDFTYIDDVVEGVVRVIDSPASPDPGWDAGSGDPSASSAPYRIYNIGNGSPVQLLNFIRAIEEETGRKAALNLLPLQPGDVTATHADTSGLEQATGYKPSTDIRAGIRRFVAWYRAYYRV
jgi:UDP-glucuronate 4-epimerase